MLKCQKYKPFNLNWFELHAVDHCNLNCLNCNHHSLFFKKSEYPASDYIPHIDEMIKRNIHFSEIGVLGGEPFLHSNIVEFVNQLKSKYDKKIIVTTNGFWLGKNYSKYEKLFSQVGRMFISIYPPIEAAIGKDKIHKIIEDIRSEYQLDIQLRDNIRAFMEIEFTSTPNIPTSFCSAQANCTNLLPNGKLARCGVGAYAHKNPSVTSEFLEDQQDMFYDLTKDDGRDFKIWKEKYPLKSCNFCTMWKEKWVPWQNKLT